jgi:hypothetical protein
MYSEGGELGFRSIMIDENGVEQPSDLLLTQ